MKKKEKEKEIGKLKEDFLQAITHKFKTPITTILGYANLILDNKDTLAAENAGYLNIIIKSAKKLDRMINKILEDRL